MVSYLVDTNVFIRFLLRDNPKQFEKIKRYFSNARSGKVKLIAPSEVIPEIEYVLRKYYGVLNIEISEKLTSILKMTYIDVEKREMWLEALIYYKKYNIDIVDALIYSQARNKGMMIFSFDKHFNKIESGIN